MKTEETLQQEMNNYDSSNEIITRHEIKDSPFQILGTEGKIFGVMGRYRITEPVEYSTEEEKEICIKKLEKEVSKITWNRIAQVLIILIEDKHQIEKEIDNALKEQENAN